MARGAAARNTDVETYPSWTPNIVCSIPDKLLKGPFTSDKLSFPRCLLSISKANINWAHSDSVRLSALAKRQGFLDHNLEAVHLFSRVRRLATSPNLVLVKFAVFEGGCDRSIVFELMVAGRSWGDRRWEDTELDAWVARETAMGNLKAKWLGVKLVELRSGRYPDPDSAYYVLGEDKLVVKSAGDFGVSPGSRFKLA